MKTYNTLSKTFTDEVKTQMGGGKSIDEAFKLVKLDIIGDDFDDPTPTPIPITNPAMNTLVTTFFTLASVVLITLLIVVILLLNSILLCFIA